MPLPLDNAGEGIVILCCAPASSVHSIIRSGLVTTISHERLEQSRWTLRWIFSSPFWGSDRGQRSRSRQASEVANSVVATIELSPPPRWLATTEPTPPSRCFTACSAVFLGAVSWKLSLTSAVSFDPCVNVNARQISRRWYRLPSPARLLPHSQTGQHQTAATV